MLQGKVVFVGDSSVGKTAIIDKYTNAVIKTTPTVGARSLSFLIKDKEGNDVVLNLWDTGGDDLKCLIPIYCRGSQIIILVFDQSDKKTFSNLESWINFIAEEVDVDKIFFVGNKSDLKSVFSIDKYQTFSTKNGGSFFSTSALNGEGIDELFREIADYISSNSVNNGFIGEIYVNDDKIHSRTDVTNSVKKSCCC